jgi:hypothetical protein
MSRHILAIIITAYIVFTSCHQLDRSKAVQDSGDSASSARLLAHELAVGDPVRDVRAALTRGDKRFIGVSAFTKFAPGVEYRNELTERYGIKFIYDITDTSGTDEATVERAIEYAQIYNLLLFRALRATGEVEWVSLGPAPSETKPSSRPVRNGIKG